MYLPCSLFYNGDWSSSVAFILNMLVHVHIYMCGCTGLSLPNEAQIKRLIYHANENPETQLIFMWKPFANILLAKCAIYGSAYIYNYELILSAMSKSNLNTNVHFLCLAQWSEGYARNLNDFKLL